MNTQKKTAEPGLYHFDFARGALVPLENPGLPAGQVVSYEDRANPRKEFVVVSDTTSQRAHTQAQTVICLEDGHRSEISMAGGKICGHWDIEDKILTADELKAALEQAEANRIRIAAEQKTASEAKAISAAKERAELIAKYGRLLEQVPPGKYASAAHGSKNLKRELTEAFPGIKFSVRSDTFSGGDSIDVSWTLGPTTEQVKAISDKYQEGHFNGMEDIYEHSRDNQWPDLFGGAKYVNESRDDGEAINTVAAALCRERGIEIPANKAWWSVRPPGCDYYGHDIGVIARQIVLAQSYPAGAVITGIEHTGETAGQWHDLYRAVFTAPAAATAADTTPRPVGGSLDISVRYNSDKNGIEITFANKPAAAVLTDLKSHGWRWSRFSSCWYQRASESAATFAARLANMAADETSALLGKLERHEPDRFDMQVEDNMAAACGL